MPAQIFHNWQQEPIPDNNSWIEFPVSVSGLPTPLSDTFGLAFLSLRTQHPYISDLEIRLKTPWGSEIVLADRVGGDGDNMDSTVFGSFNFPSIVSGAPPFNGTFRPQQSLGACNEGQNGNGLWLLKIRDLYPSDEGNFLGWHIHFSNQPAGRFPFTDSNLPIFIINTGTQPIVNEPKVNGYLQVIHAGSNLRNYVSDSAMAVKLRMGIETRGSSSQGFPKKSFGLELRNASGADTSLALLDLPAESDWVLSANYTDKSFMRNTFAYYLAREMGWYAPRTRYVEVLVNNEYQGIYVLTEKIKRDANRVNISKLKYTDTTANAITGGYIFKIDKSTGNDVNFFTSQFPPVSSTQGQIVRFYYDYPKYADLHAKQKAYLKNYVDSFELALAGPNFQHPESGYRRYIHLPSFLDYLLINEWSKNTDGYRISTYLTKPKNNQFGGKLLAGPVWDFDIAWRNANYCSGQSTIGWAYNFPDVCPDDYFQPPFWWKRLRQDPSFNTELKCRWEELNNILMPAAKRNAWIDSVAALLQEAQERNFTYWPILGQYVWPNPTPIPTSYAGEVAAFKSWLNNRRSWIQANLGSTCLVNVEKSIEGATEEIYAFPNPGTGIFHLNVKSTGPCIIQDLLGKKYYKPMEADGRIDIRDLPSGTYWLYRSMFESRPIKIIKL